MQETQKTLSKFHGGLRLEPRNEATQTELLTAPVPERLLLPLHQHFGTPARPVVSPGDAVLRGQLIAENDGYVSGSVHASTSGRVLAIEPRPMPHPAGIEGQCIVIEADGEDRPTEPLEPLQNYRHNDPGEVRARVRAAGVVGLGGAVFPTSVKLTARADAHLRTLILNGAECEPYISCDEMLMRTRAERVVAGAKVMLHALQINECLIAVEADKTAAAEAMAAALELTADERLALIRVPAIYPEGGERQLIQVLTGDEVPHDGLPLDIGYVCHNVGTAAAVADAVLDGQPLISRIVTVTGSGVRTPRNVEARLGTPVHELVKLAGGYAENVQRLVMGGAMMGFALGTDEVPVVKATNCILALSGDEIRSLDGEMPCIRCGECARVCPAVLLPQQLHWYIRSGDYEQVQGLHLFDCIECGCCDLVCPSHIPLVDSFRIAKGEIWARERERQRRELARRRYEAHERRLARREGERKQRRESSAEAPDQTPGHPAGDERQRVIEEAVARVKAKRRDRDHSDH